MQGGSFKITGRGLKISLSETHTFFIKKGGGEKCQTLEQKDLKIFKVLARLMKLNKLYKSHSWERLYFLLQEHCSS